VNLVHRNYLKKERRADCYDCAAVEGRGFYDYLKIRRIGRGLASLILGKVFGKQLI